MQGAGTDRARALNAGVRIEQLTIGWMAIEAAVAVGAGLAAGSVLLTAFGIDSVIELATGGILLWRLLAEAGDHRLEGVERAERVAAWVTGVALALLCAYIVAMAVAGLLARAEPQRSYAGIVVAIVAAIGMPLLARRKREIADRIGSAALRADAACSITCAYMAGTLLIGLGLNVAFHWWWADSVAALGLLCWLQREAREALDAARTRSSVCTCGPG